MRYTNNEKTNMLIRWCKVFISKTEKELKEALKEIISNKSKVKLLEYVNKLSGDDEMVELYTNLSRRDLEYNTKLEEALETKEMEYNSKMEEELEKKENLYKKDKFELAKSFLKANVDIDTVSKIMGISKEELEKIKL